MHNGFSVGEKIAEPLRICNREAFVNCSDQQVFPLDANKCLRVVKVGQNGLLRFGALISITDQLHEAQDLAFS